MSNQSDAQRLVEVLDELNAQCEDVAAEMRRLVAQRDALLEALKFVIRGVPDTWEGVQKAKAAIKAAEEDV